MRRRALLVAALQLALASHVAAQRDDAKAFPGWPTAESAQAGMFLPYTIAPRTDSQRAFALVLSGYDMPRKQAQLEGTADVTLFGPLAARVGVLYGQTSSRLRPSAGLRLQALSQASHGIDMAVGAFYRPEGFTEAEGEVEVLASFARSFGHLGLFANLIYGQDPEGAERDGEVRLACAYAWSARFRGGIDTRIRFDLGSAASTRRTSGEAEYDFVVGPTASYVLGDVALIAQAGLSGVGYHQPRFGPVALAGLAGAL
ncbi:MAG: hypothetical protein ACHQ53_14830 [Polyangiales bacterium]